MGGMLFDPKVLADTLSETVGYKAGLALSIEQMCDLLGDSSYPDLILASEEHVIRIRSEEYEALFYRLLQKVGHTTEEYNGDITGAYLYHKYKDTAPDVHAGMVEMFVEMWPKLMDGAHARDTNLIDPTPFIRAAADKYGKLGLQMAGERLDALSKGLNLNPHTLMRYTEWSNIEDLSALFKGSNRAPEYGEFFDQRFIDFLEQNPSALGNMHWRKFEELTAEYFVRQGFTVRLGPGGNDDGVDVRIWMPDDTSTGPHGIVQCKRQKDKVEKVVVKGLMSDVLFEKADLGLIVTTSELSVGARKTISTRGYSIQEINKDGVANWLSELRTPGTGIVRR
jgi:restriction system protein